MLHWRLILTAIVLTLVLGLAWIDFQARLPGLVMLPLALVGAWMCAGEIVGLYEKAAANALGIPLITARRDKQQSIPSRPLVYAATMTTVVASAGPILVPQLRESSSTLLGWLAVGMVGGLLLALLYEMWIYQGPGQPPGTIATRVARTTLAILYAGGLMGFVVQLRLMPGGRGDVDARWGMVALLTTIAVVKGNDTGAYFAGRLFGRHRMTPRLSPGKTWEGTLGGYAFSAALTALFLGPIAASMGCTVAEPPEHWWARTLCYSALVGTAGVLGDLAVSLLKRDAGVKDSSTWMPGFGGMLDMLDSILLAAPVSYVLWWLGLVGP